MPRNMNATPSDLQELFRLNALAASQLETIIVKRLLIEAEAKIANLNGAVTADQGDSNKAESAEKVG